MSRRSYDHYCTVSRALDVVGDRWSLLVVRELLAGPRRYSDLFADLPGISTDMLAARLKDLEREGIVTRETGGHRVSLYELTESGRKLRPVLEALSGWGVEHLGERQPTDAVRAHWFAMPLAPHVAALVPDGEVTLHIGDTTLSYRVADGVATSIERGADDPRLELHLDVATATDIVNGRRSLNA